MKILATLPSRFITLAFAGVIALAVAGPRASAAREAYQNYGQRVFLAANASEREARRRDSQEQRPQRGVRAVDAPPDRSAFPAVQPDNRRTGQLSPDERRALRREIDDFGRDVYRAPRGKR